MLTQRTCAGQLRPIDISILTNPTNSSGACLRKKPYPIIQPRLTLRECTLEHICNFIYFFGKLPPMFPSNNNPLIKQPPQNPQEQRFSFKIITRIILNV